VTTTARPTVRSMRAEEAEAVGWLTLAAYDAYGTISGDYRAYLADPLERIDGATALLVAELDGQAVGTVTYVLPGDEAWEGRPRPEGDCGFRVLAVDPAAEGRGVGGALVDTCIGMARAEGRHRMIITSMAWMTRAHLLYARRGFERRPDLDVAFPGGRGVVFHLDLTSHAQQRFGQPGPAVDPPPWYEDAWEL
jgi:GNAT superfamily N-acetyltransferase